MEKRDSFLEKNKALIVDHVDSKRATPETKKPKSHAHEAAESDWRITEREDERGSEEDDHSHRGAIGESCIN